METKNYMNFAKRLVMVLAVVLMAVNMWGGTATFTWGTNKTAYTSGDSNISEGIVNFLGEEGTATTPARAWSDGLRIYAGNTVTFSVPDGYVITKIEGFAAFNYDNSTGEQSVAFSSLAKATCSSDVTVTYQSSGDAITLHKNNDDATGSTAGAGTIAADATSMTISTTPTRPGYHVAGYYTAASEGTKIADANGALQPNVTVSATTWTNGSSQWKKGGDATFYTYWEANSYEVAFDKNGGTGTMENEEFTYGTAQALTECGFTAPQHKYFLGWNTDKNATTATYAEKASANNLTTENNGTVTLYAIWKDYSYENYRTKCCTPLDAPENMAISVTGTQAATVSWDDVEHASGYEYTLDGGENWTAATSPLSLTSTEGLEGATEYSIQVRATGDGTTYCAEGTAADAVAFKTWATVTAASNDALMGTAQVSKDNENWASSVAAADGTKIYLKATASGDSYEWYEWATPASGSISDNEFTGWSGNVTVTANFRTKSLTKLATPEGMASSSITAISAVVSWTAVEHASTYAVICEKTDDHSTTGIVIGDIDGTSCTISGLTANTGYTWTVKAVGDNSSYKDGDACEGQTFTTDKKKPATVEITTAPSKTTYNSGEAFDATGMVVKVTYNNGDIDAAYTGYTVSPSTALSPSNMYVTVTATMNEVSASVEQAITVNAKLTWKAAGAEDVITYASSGKVVMPTGADPIAPSCLGDFDTFQGWSASAISVSTDVEPSYVSEETDAAADATFYAVFAKMGDGDVEDENSTFTVKGVSAPGSPYVADDGATWTYSSVTFGNTNPGFAANSSAWIQVTLPENATEAVDYTITQGNSWAGAAKSKLTSGSTEITDITGSSLSYDFTSSNKSLGTYKLANVSSTTKGCWIDHITINYKKVGQVPVEWATTCCTPWEAPAISYSVSSGWKNGDDAVSVSIAEGTTYGNVSYESSNTDVLTVAANGAITAVAPGTATVTATWAGGVEDAVKYCEASSVSATIDVSGTVTVTFNKNDEGATGTMTAQDMTYKTSTALSTNAFEKTGYSFVGWALTTDGEKAYDDEEAVSLSGDVTLYALWTINSHSVTLTQPTVSEVAAGTIKANNSTTPGSINYGVEVTLTATEVANENDGYAFDSWSVTGATPESTTEKTTSFTMPDNVVTVAAVYHHYTWNLSGYTVTTEPEDLEFTDVETFDKSAFGITANYARSDAHGNKDVTYAGAWSVKLGDDAIVDGYAFKLADDGKHLTFWVGELKIYDKEVTVTEIPKDQFVVNIWTTEVGTIEAKTGDNYTMPTVSNQTAGAAATCKDHNIFIGWVEAEFADEPEGHIIEGGTTGQTASNKTYYAVWAKPEEQDLAAGYRLVTEAPAGEDSVILAAWHSAGYQALQNSGSGTASTLTLSDGIITNPNGKGFKVIAVSGGKQFQKGSSYIHFNSGELKVANNTGNATATLTSLDGGTFRIYGNYKYMLYNGTKFTVTDAQKDATPIYIFKKQAASKVVVNTDYRTDCAPRYTVSFDANGGSGSYDAVEKKEGKTIDLPDDNYFEKEWHTLAGWNTKADGTGDNYTTTYTVGNANVTLYAQWNEVSKADVVFKNGEATVQTVADKHQGESYDLIAAPAAAEGKQFTGWRSSVDNELYDAEATGFTMSTPAAEVVYTAEWLTVVPTPTAEVITTADLTNGEWVLVTDANQLRTGDVVIIAAAGSDVALGLQHIDGAKCWRTETSITKDGNKISNPSDNVAKLFVQNGYDNGQFGLYDMNTANKGYLLDVTGGNYLGTQSGIVRAGSWIITIENGEADIQSAESNKYIMYNGTYDRFSCYNSGQSAIALYKWVKKITSDMNVSDVTLTDAVIVTDGKTLTVDEDATLDNLTVENGGKVQIAENKQLDVQDFYIGGTHGKSGQVMNAENLHVDGEAYFDFTLGVDVSTDEGAAKAEAQWHNFSVPFPVSATSGVYGWKEGEWKKLTNEVDYAIEDYHGELRKNGEYGWKKFRSIMTPGHTYSMTVNGDIQTYRFKKAGDYTFDADPTVGFSQHAATGSGTSSDAGWNGLGNMRLCYSSISNDKIAETEVNEVSGRYVLVLNAEEYRYDAYLLSKINLTVGSAFFIQASADGTMSFNEAQNGAGKIYAPARIQGKVTEPIMVTMSGERGTDHMYISADEDATSTYQIGRDMQRMFATSNPTTPLIYTMNYGGLKLAAEDAPMVYNQAVYTLQLYAPIAGEYTLQTEAVTDADVYLTYEGAIIWNISESEYTVDLSKGKNNGYGLKLVKKAPSVVTGIDQIDAKAGAQKVIIDEHVYILRGGQMYDVNGKLVK